MKIRRGTISDLHKIANLWLKLVNELAPELTPNAIWWKKLAGEHIKTNNYMIFVAELGGRIIGFIDYFLFPEPATSKLHCVGQHLYILPEYRKQNVAGNLWKTAIKTSKLQGAQVHELFCFEKEVAFWNKRKFHVKRLLLRR